MRTRLLVLFVWCLFAAVSWAQPRISVIRIDGSINPSSARYVRDALERARQEGCTALLLELNTPGGLLSSTRDIVSDLLASPLPVIVYVAPSGAQAASAGAFVTMAAHVAVMAPGTNIGASHPVNVGGENPSDSTDIGMTKATNDAAAFARTIAARRGRNVDMAERFVRQSESITDQEALAAGVIDTIAATRSELLGMLEGRRVVTASGEHVLRTRDAVVEQHEMNFREQLLDLLSDPNIAYILMMLGMYGLFFELYNPGSVFPGVVGGISLILALYSFNTLPLNTAGIALILLSIILFLLEIKVVSHGLLSIGGVLALLLGSLMLFDSPDGWEVIEVSLSVILTITLCTTLFFLFVLGKGVAIQKRKPVTGVEGLVGEMGIAIDALAPVGRVLVHGEYWNARADHSLAAGTTVIVRAVANLLLFVEEATVSANTPSEQP